MGKIAWKEVEPFLGLLLATAIVMNAREYLRKDRGTDPKKKRVLQRLGQESLRSKKKIFLAVAAGVAVGFLFLGLFFHLFKVPAMLDSTHKDVAQSKLEARRQCRQLVNDGDLVEAEAWIRNNTLGKILHKELEAKQRMTLDRALRPLTYELFIRSGPFLPVLPLFVVLLVALALRLLGKDWPQSMPTEADWAFVLLPALYSCLYVAWVSSTVFHFWIRERQVTNCMLVSGEWYTTWHTAFAFVCTLFLIRIESGVESPGDRRWTNPGSKMSSIFIAWFFAYLALVSGPLSTSQRFHHDWEESLAGVAYMLRVMTLSAIAWLVGCAYGLDNAFVEASVGENEGEDVDSLKEEEKILSSSETSFSAAIKCGQICCVLENFTAETESELTVSKGLIVRTISEAVDGWIEVENMEEKYGFVPVDFLELSEEKFQLEVWRKRRLAYEEATSNSASNKEKNASQPQKPSEKEHATLPSRKPPAFLQDLVSKNVQLRSVEERKEREPRTNSSVDGGSGIMAAVARELGERRKVIQTDEDDDSEWQD